MRTRPCSTSIAQGRLRKANQFATAADTIRDMADEDEEVSDTFVSLCVLAGIAASDVICGRSLGKHGHTSATKEEVKKADRAASALVEKARRTLVSTNGQ